MEEGSSDLEGTEEEEEEGRGRAAKKARRAGVAGVGGEGAGEDEGDLVEEYQLSEDDSEDDVIEGEWRAATQFGKVGDGLQRACCVPCRSLPTTNNACLSAFLAHTGRCPRAEDTPTFSKSICVAASRADRTSTLNDRRP